jgi:hypothetical protein
MISIYLFSIYSTVDPRLQEVVGAVAIRGLMNSQRRIHFHTILAIHIWRVLVTVLRVFVELSTRHVPRATFAARAVHLHP